MQSIKEDCPAGTPACNRTWVEYQLTHHHIISLENCFPTRSPTCQDALLLFLLLTRLLSSKTFCDRKLCPIHSAIIYPPSTSCNFYFKSSSHFNPNHDNNLPLSLLSLRLFLLLGKFILNSHSRSYCPHRKLFLLSLPLPFSLH